MGENEDAPFAGGWSGLTSRRGVDTLPILLFDIPSGFLPDGPVATDGMARYLRCAALHRKCDIESSPAANAAAEGDPSK